MGVVILSFYERPDERLEELAANPFQDRVRLGNKKGFRAFTKN